MVELPAETRDFVFFEMHPDWLEGPLSLIQRVLGALSCGDKVAEA
jgi:hypothetical protein